MSAPFDPKTEITEHAFVIPSHYLGLPLASPTKRLFAFLLDLLLVGLLSGLGYYTLSGLLAVLAYRRVRNKELEGKLSTFKNRFTAFAAAFGLFLLSFSILLLFDESDETKNLEDKSEFVEIQKELNFSNSMDLESLINKDSLTVLDAKTLAKIATDFANSLDEVHTTSTKRLTDEEQFIIKSFLEKSSEISELKQYDSLRVIAAKLLAQPEINAYIKKIRSYQKSIHSKNATIEELTEQVDHPSFISMALALANDVGFAFGWGGLYFVFSIAWFKGQTLAKRLFKIRVIKLNGKPLGVWYSFERFGGYAAGLATGLLGFMQIMWDPNRQAVHDKISGTVVIDESTVKR